MALISLRQLLDHAAEHSYGVPAFNVNNLEQTRAIMEAADETDSPVIMQASAGARKYAGAPFLRALMEAAMTEFPHVPVVVHQDHGTSAAVEYAVTALKVAHIVVLGHSSCGGVNGCIQMVSGNAPELEKPNSFVGRWMDILRPACEDTASISDPHERQKELEKRSVLVSMANLMTFPFVSEAVRDGRLSLHGLWTDIASGGLECYDPARAGFVQV